MKKLALSLVTVLSLASYSPVSAATNDTETVKSELTVYCNKYYADNGKGSEVCRYIMANEGKPEAWANLDAVISALTLDIKSLTGPIQSNAASELLQIADRLPGEVKISHSQLFDDLRKLSETK